MISVQMISAHILLASTAILGVYSTDTLIYIKTELCAIAALFMKAKYF